MSTLVILKIGRMVPGKKGRDQSISSSCKIKFQQTVDLFLEIYYNISRKRDDINEL